MKRIIASCAVFVAFTCILLAHPQAYAGPDKPPTKESLQVAWENAQKADPDTVKFEPTKDPKVYTFETTTFPYKGTIKIINLVIDKWGAYYYDDDDDYSGNSTAGHYSGIVEVELSGIDKDFKEKFQYSYNKWARNNRLTYDDWTSKWYTREEWNAYKKANPPAGSTCSGSAPPTATSQKSDTPTGFSVFLSWFPMLLLIGVWLFFVRFARRSQIKMQDKYFAEAEKSRAILNEILAAIKAKA